MANPPFSLNITAPANTDIAANYPTLDRSDKDVIQSWITVQHNNQGRHNLVTLDIIAGGVGLGSAPTVAAGQCAIYYDTNFELRMYRGDVGVAENLGVPSGTVIMHASFTVPQGYLACNGQAVSRSTYAKLFAAIGTQYGAGDGSTTFNLPDCRGRVIAGFDSGNATGRLTSAVSANNLGNNGGEQLHTLTTGEMPVHNHGASSSGTVSISDPGHAHGISDPGHAHGITDLGHTHTVSVPNGGGFQQGNNGGSVANGSFHNVSDSSSTTGITINGATTGISVNGAFTGITATTSISTSTSNAGSGGAHNVVQPTLILNYFIKI